jgi:MFS family permease
VAWRAASWPQAGAPAGQLIANGVLAGLAAFQREAAFNSWGWRIPFLLSAVPVVCLAVGPAADRGVADLRQGAVGVCAIISVIAVTSYGETHRRDLSTLDKA